MWTLKYKHSVLQTRPPLAIDNAIALLIAVVILPASPGTCIGPASASTTTPATNRSLTDDRVLTICTHDGVFHADEALACYMLKVVHPNARIVRSREPALHESSDIVLDVGMVYDAHRHRYDHHQQNFSETMSSVSPVLRSPIRLSSAGLIYHHFGRAVLRILTGETDDAKLEYLYRMLYYALIQEIDGIDNGVPQHNSSRPQYYIGTDLSTRVGRLNRPSFVSAGAKSWNESTQFAKAMALAGDEFRENVAVILQQEYPAREVVQKAVERRHDVHASGQIVEFEKYCPWENHLFEIEEQRNIQSQTKFVLYPTERGEYHVQCVPATSHSYDCRKSLPKRWRGLKDEKLSRTAGIEGCVFAHAGGFVGGHKTRNGALQMAVKSLAQSDDED